MTRIVFAGTPDFALASLKALVDAGRVVVGASLVNALQHIGWNASAFELTSYDLSADYTDLAIQTTTTRYDDLDDAGRRSLSHRRSGASPYRQSRLVCIGSGG